MNTRTARAGFTLIELLAVLLILSILVGILVTSLGGAEDATQQSLTENFIAQIEVALSEYEIEHGDYPRSSFGPGLDLAANEMNVGAEALVVAFFSGGWEAAGAVADDRLGNSDGDRSKKSLTDFGSRDLFEIMDSWDNPIAYFHHSEYGRPQWYTTFDTATGEPIETEVHARTTATTQRLRNPRSFQLISAGLDGRFGTEDDLGNWSE